MLECMECGEVLPARPRHRSITTGSKFQRCCKDCQNKLITEAIASHHVVLQCRTDTPTSLAGPQAPPRPNRVTRSIKRRQSLSKRARVTARGDVEVGVDELSDSNVASSLSNDANDSCSRDPIAARETRAEKVRQAMHTVAELAFVDELRNTWPNLLDEVQQRQRNGITRALGEPYPRVTPDVLFRSPVDIFGKKCSWIEYKDSSIFRYSHSDQFERYVDHFGPGIAVYKSLPVGGFATIDGVSYRSEKEVLQHVQQRTEPTTSQPPEAARHADAASVFAVFGQRVRRGLSALWPHRSG